MTCKKCGHKEIIYLQESPENSILRCCPLCDKLRILSKDESTELIKRQYQYLDNLFINHIKKFNKKSLIVWLLGYREEIASKFITENPFINLEEFLSLNIIIKRAMEIYNEDGSINANFENTKSIISFYLDIIRTKEMQFSIEEEFGYFVADEDFNLKDLDSINPSLNLKFVHNKDWMTVIESFNQAFIMPGESAGNFVKENKEEYEKNKIVSPEPREFAPKEVIHNAYYTLQSFKVGLTKNSLFAETFNFDHIQNKKVLIEIFQKLTEYFDFEDGLLRVVYVEEFKQFLIKQFGELDQDKLYTDLVFSYNNQVTFPFFVELENNTVTTAEGTVENNNFIFISKFFLRILGIFQYPFYYKKLFDNEKQLLSDQFEKIDVPKKFHENGFNVRVNIEKKDLLQIDTIAWNNSTLYVIETKIWDVDNFFEHRRVHNYRERDLKGIVDGYKYTNGEPKEIPNLIDKINYVQSNFVEVLCKYKETQMFPDHDTIDNSIIKKTIGVIITKSYPLIKEYNGVKMLGLNEIKDL